MRLTRPRFTTRSLMLVVGICALVIWLIIWLIPIGYRWAWTWTVISDVNRGQSTRRIFGDRISRAAGPRALPSRLSATRSKAIKLQQRGWPRPNRSV